MKLFASLLLTAFVLIAGPLCWGQIERRRESESLDVFRLGQCLKEMEGGNPDRLGGAWCLSKAVWDDRVGPMDYEESRNPTICGSVARFHIRWLIAQFEKAKIRPTPAIIGAAWRYGLHSYLLTRRTGDYGQRLSALYYDKP